MMRTGFGRMIIAVIIVSILLPAAVIVASDTSEASDIKHVLIYTGDESAFSSEYAGIINNTATAIEDYYESQHTIDTIVDVMDDVEDCNLSSYDLLIVLIPTQLGKTLQPKIVSYMNSGGYVMYVGGPGTTFASSNSTISQITEWTGFYVSTSTSTTAASASTVLNNNSSLINHYERQVTSLSPGVTSNIHSSVGTEEYISTHGTDTWALKVTNTNRISIYFSDYTWISNSTTQTLTNAQPLLLNILDESVQHRETIGKIYSPIIYHVNGGTIYDTPYSTEYQEGTEVTLVKDIRYSGKGFCGWYDNSEFTGEPIEKISKSEKGYKEYWAMWSDHIVADLEYSDHTLIEFSSLERAVSFFNSNANSTLRLLEDMSLSSPLTLSASYGTVMLNGHSLSSSDGHRIFNIAKYSTITIDGSCASNTVYYRIQDNVLDISEETLQGYTECYRSMFKNCSATNDSTPVGGAIYNEGSLTVRYISFFLNLSESGGAIFSDGSSIVVENSIFDSNKTSGSKYTGAGQNCGGALTSNNTSSTTISDSYFNRNTSKSGGGAIAIIGSGTLGLIGNTITNNQSNNGGGIYSNSKTSSLTIYSSNCGQYNTADSTGGFIYFSGPTAITDGIFSYNQQSPNSKYPYGGCIYCSDELTITGGKFTNNSGTYGGAIYGTKTITISGESTEITNNTSTRNGGGIFAVNGLNISGGLISNNVSSDNGGGVFIDGGTFNLGGAVISYNKSTNYGSGVFIKGTANLSGGTITANYSNNGGGSAIAIIKQSTVNIYGAVIQDNQYSTSGYKQMVYARDSTINIYDSAIVKDGIRLLTSNLYIYGSPDIRYKDDAYACINIDESSIIYASNEEKTQPYSGPVITIGVDITNLYDGMIVVRNVLSHPELFSMYNGNKEFYLNYIASEQTLIYTKYEARINSMYYMSLDGAIVDAADNDHIYLLKSSDLRSQYDISATGVSNNITIHGDNYTITDKSGSGYLFVLTDAKTLTLIDLTIVSDEPLKEGLLNLTTGDIVTLRNVTIRNYNASNAIINSTYSENAIYIDSLNMSNNTVQADKGAILIQSESTLRIKGNCYIAGNLTSDSVEKDIILTSDDQLIIVGNIDGSIGVKFNDVYGGKFGTATGGYTGINNIFNTECDYIIGSYVNMSVVWSGKSYTINYDLGIEMKYGSYLYGPEETVLDTSFTRKGFHFLKWLDYKGDDIVAIPAFSYGDVTVTAVWVQTDLFISSDGDDATGDGTDDNPYRTFEKAYSVAEDGNTISLLSDITVTATIELALSKDITVSGGNELFEFIRGDDFGNNLFNFVYGKTTFINVGINGNNNLTGVDHSLVYMQKTSVVIFDSNTILHNNIITDNSMSTEFIAGAIHMTDDAKLYIRSGCEIKSNVAYGGSAIYASSNSSIIMTGGTIKENYCYSYVEGGAVYISSTSTMSVSGLVMIDNNLRYSSISEPYAANLYLVNGSVLNIDGEISTDSSVSISVSVEPSSSDDIPIVRNATEETLSVFKNDLFLFNLLLCDGTENDFGLYHHYPCIPGTIFLTVSEIHIHMYGATFTWREDFSDVEVELVCGNGICRKTITELDSKTITHELVRPATCVEDGLMKHTVTITYHISSTQTSSNQETVAETLTRLGHDYVHGYCTRCPNEDPEDIYCVRIDGHDKYEDLREAYEDLESGHSLMLIKNISLPEQFIINKNMTLTSYGGIYSLSSGFDGNAMLSVQNSTILDLTNIILNGNNEQKKSSSRGMLLDIDTGATVNIYVGTEIINSRNNDENGYGAISVGHGTLNLYGGTISGNYSLNHGAGIYVAADGKVYLKGDIVIQNNYLYDKEDVQKTTPSNVTLSSTEQFIFDCDNFSGIVSVDYNNELIAPFAVFKSGSGETLITNDTDRDYHAMIEGTILVWVMDYNVDFYLGKETEFPVPFQTIVTTYMSTYGPMKDGVLEGHTFLGWFTQLTGGTQVFPNSVVYYKSSHHLYAHWSVNIYTITVNTNSEGGTYTVDLPYNDPVSINTPTKTGHTFVSWSQTIPERMPAYNFAIDAIWSINSYTITFDSNGGSAVKSVTQEYNSVILMPKDPTMRGYSFDGWDQDVPERMPAYDMHLTAVWAINYYIITFDSNSGTYVPSITVAYNDVIQMPTSPTRAGYVFNNWDGSVYYKMPDHDITLKARWNANHYKIVFDTDGGSVIETIWADCGSKIDKPSNPTKQGYTFAGWDKAIPDEVPPYNMTIKAYWSPNTDTKYKVQHMTENSDGSYKIMETENLTGTTGEEITVNLRSYQNHTEGKYERSYIGADGRTVVNVYYDLVSIKVMFNSSGGSSVPTQYVKYGCTAAIPDQPSRSGFIFHCWNLGDEEYDFNTPVTKETVLTAVWSACDTYINVNNASSGIKIEINNGSSVITSGFTDENGKITFKNVPFGSLNVVASSADGSSTITKGIILTSNTANIYIDMPSDKVNTKLEVSTTNTVSVTNLDKTISESERESVKSDENIKSLTLTLSVSETDLMSALEKIGLGDEIIESYNICIYKDYIYIDSTSSRTQVTASDGFQIILIGLTQNVIDQMKAKGYDYKNITVYHSHNDSAYKMKMLTSLEEIVNSTVESFAVVEVGQQQYIAIKSSTYSTFAVGFTEAPQSYSGTSSDMMIIIVAAIIGIIVLAAIVHLCLKGKGPEAQ